MGLLWDSPWCAPACGIEAVGAPGPPLLAQGGKSCRRAHTCVLQVVSKYIESPVLFLREDVGKVKFDIRYVVLLRTVQPLTLFVYDVFWLRFSNR